MLTESMRARVRDTLCRFWHYTDEEKAYAPKEIASVLRTMDALNYIGRFHEAYDDDFALEVMELLNQREKLLIRLEDPAALRIPLWQGNNIPDLVQGVNYPGSPDGEDFRPFIIPWLQKDEQDHPAMIVISGGQRVNRSEGGSYCRYFQSIGFQVFQLGHRIEWGHKGTAVPNAALDLQRAIRFIRCRAAQYHVEADHIFAIGSSLGGVTIVHMLEELPHSGTPGKCDKNYRPDDTDLCSDRLNGMLGIYTSSYPRSPRREGIDYSVYPPVFAVMGGSDIAVDYQLAFYNELVQHGVSAEIHLFNGAVHGFGIGDSVCAPSGFHEKIDSVSVWPELARIWTERVCSGRALVGRQPFTTLKTSGKNSEAIQQLLYPSWPGFPG